MRLNPFYPSDDPMSSVFYCFGGGGDDGGGGDSRSEADRSYEDDFGFSSDLADKYSGSAADVGGRDDNGSALRSAMNTATASALANIDTALLADISTPMMSGDFVNPTTGFGMMQDIPGPAMQSAIDAAQLATPGLYGSKATTGDSFAGLLGDSPESSFGFYETIPVPRGSESNVFDPLVAGKQDEHFRVADAFGRHVQAFTDLQGQYGAQSDQLTALDEQFGLVAAADPGPSCEDRATRRGCPSQSILGIAGVAPVASSAMTQDDVYNLFGGPGPRTAALGTGPRSGGRRRAMT
jgi:hypothetical protein